MGQLERTPGTRAAGKEGKGKERTKKAKGRAKKRGHPKSKPEETNARSAQRGPGERGEAKTKKKAPGEARGETARPKARGKTNQKPTNRRTKQSRKARPAKKKEKEEPGRSHHQGKEGTRGKPSRGRRDPLTAFWYRPRRAVTTRSDRSVAFRGSHVIKLEGVSKIFKGDVVALKNATAEIQRGEFVFLVGPSGSGKSTFIRLLNREEIADEGRIMVAGKDLSSLSPWKVPYLRRNIGYIFQDYKLLPKKTVYENVAFGLEVIGRPRQVIRQQVPAILELVGLARKAERLPDELSGGEKQRVSIARAFVNRPMILLADEPTGNLDPGTSVGIMRLLDRINRSGTTVVMATHDRGVVDTMRRRVIELDRGVITRDESRGVYE